MKPLALPLLLAGLIGANSACSTAQVEPLPDESSLTAQIHYLVEGKRVKVVRATTNFDAYRGVFLLGFTTGYEDILGDTMTPIHFGEAGRRADFFCGVGYGFGARAAKEDMKNRPNKAQPPTPEAGTPAAAAAGSPVPYVANLRARQ